jgi:flagella basal body P-ring formation protein FlgA
MKLLTRLLALTLAGLSGLCQASVGQAQLSQIQKSIEQLLQTQSAGLPGKVSFTLGAIDPRQNLSACDVPQAFLPAGARFWGNTSVGVRCGGASPWVIYVPLTVKVETSVVVATQALTQGRIIMSSDLALQEADLCQLPAAVITEAGQALGRILGVSIAAGQPLRQDLLRSPPVIQQGQSVTLRAQGTGFKVSAAGKAVNNAIEGQVTQVRTPSGQTVNGIARVGGIVEIVQ